MTPRRRREGDEIVQAVEPYPEEDAFDDLEYVEWDVDDVGDYWLEAGEEVEFTAEFHYEEA